MKTARLTLALLALAALGATPAAAKVLKFPRFTVPPRSDREVCFFVRLPNKAPLDLGGTLIVNKGVKADLTSHHFLMWAYKGVNPNGFPSDIQDSKACLDFGPLDRTQRILIGGSQTPRLLTRLPKGLAQKVEPLVGPGGAPDGIGLILNTHWINASDKPQNASVKIKFLRARGKTKRLVQPLFEVVGNGFIDVPPGASKDSGWVWAPGGIDFSGGGLGGGVLPTGPACVVQLTAHMHQRGKLFTIDFEHDGTSERLFETTDYTDPGQRLFNGEGGNPGPLLVKPGERLRYTCTHDNGVEKPVKMGCEEQAGVAPGKAIIETFPRTDGAAKRCETDGDCPATDPNLPGRTFTGRCVPANLVFGYTSEDDMCILPGAFYDAIPDAPPGQECDLNLL